MKFDVEVDTREPIRKILQKIYEVKLWYKWSNQNYINPKLSLEFIKYALKNLPNGSFVIFNFDTTNEKFIQFGNFGGNLTLDIPFWITNDYFNKESELKSLLKTLNIEKSKIEKANYGKDKRTIDISFEKDYLFASKVTLNIAEVVFGISKPCVFDYSSDRLSK